MQYEILNGESMLEREIENLLEQILRNCGWIVDVGVKNRQVYRQQPRSIDEINKLKVNGIQTFPDFILYEDENIAVPIAVIEAKRVEYKNLEKAKEQGLNYAKALGARFLFLYNANRFIAYYVPTEEVLLIDNEEVNGMLPLAQLRLFNGRKLELNSKVDIKSKTDLINVFKVANDKLREAGINAGIARFTEFSNLLFLKLLSELNEERHYNIAKPFLWDSYRNLDGKCF